MSVKIIRSLKYDKGFGNADTNIGGEGEGTTG